MKINEVDFANIVTNKDLEDGSLILLTSRPAMGKTQTCLELIKTFKEKYDYIYFDLSCGGTSFWKGNVKIDDEYKNSYDIIKSLEKFVKRKNAKFVIIDYWQLVEDGRDWFIRKLLEFSWEYKLVIIIPAQLNYVVEKRKNHLPKIKDLKRFKHLYKFAKKIIAIGRPAMYGENVEDKLNYYVYKDINNNYFNQEE